MTESERYEFFQKVLSTTKLHLRACNQALELYQELLKTELGMLKTATGMERQTAGALPRHERQLVEAAVVSLQTIQELLCRRCANLEVQIQAMKGKPFVDILTLR